ncbi:hypothetical protein BDR07DRAFT_1485815 [Suillus spraguei]|nr:hypothetical protein BDR07DRAFT_1485815 [Suillus spraguei]
MLSLRVLVLSVLALGVTATVLPYHDHEVLAGRETCAAECKVDSDCGSTKCYCVGGGIAWGWCESSSE